MLTAQIYKLNEMNQLKLPNLLDLKKAAVINSVAIKAVAG
jgi:hypothetical protein